MISEYQDQRLEVLNKVLRILMGLMLVYTAMQVFSPRQRNLNSFSATQQIEPPPSAEFVPFEPAVRSFDDYASVFAATDLFSSKLEAVQGEPARQQHQNIQSEHISRNLKVVGIVVSDRPQVIIEDVRAGQTAFLYPGEAINGAVVKEIREGNVILSYQGEDIQLAP